VQAGESLGDAATAGRKNRVTGRVGLYEETLANHGRFPDRWMNRGVRQRGAEAPQRHRERLYNRRAEPAGVRARTGALIQLRTGPIWGRECRLQGLQAPVKGRPSREPRPPLTSSPAEF
jgi:IS5 family transposase